MIRMAYGSREGGGVRSWRRAIAHTLRRAADVLDPREPLHVTAITEQGGRVISTRVLRLKDRRERHGR